MVLETVRAEWEQWWSAAVALERLRAMRRAVYGQCGHCHGEVQAVSPNLAMNVPLCSNINGLMSRWITH